MSVTFAAFTWKDLQAQFEGEVPTLLAAAGVLIGGWLVALIISWLVKKALQRTRIDDRIAASLSEEDKPAPDMSRAVGRIVFWVLMLIVLVAFFQVLGLAAVTGPLNRFLDQLFEYAPRILAAVGLAVIAWVVATVARLIVRKALEATRLDERVSDEVETPIDEEDTGRATRARRARSGLPRRPLALSKTVANAAYWLVWLLFIPAILNALALEGLLAPVQNLVNKVLGFMPNLLLAAAILVFGWFLARVIQRLTTNLLAAFGADELSERVGVSRALGNARLSTALGVVVHVLVLIPVFIAALDALQVAALTAPASQMLNDILTALPNILGAILIVGIAVIVAKLVAGLVSNVLAGVGFDSLPTRLGLTSSDPKKPENKPSNIAGTVVMVGIILLAVMQALRLMHFVLLEGLLASFLVFAGNVLLGLFIIGVGLYASNFVAGLIRDSQVRQANLLAVIARVAILALAGAMGLQEMGLAPEVVTLAFGLTFGAIAVAAAIAFGVGGREQAKELIEEFVQERRKKGASANSTSSTSRRTTRRRTGSGG